MYTAVYMRVSKEIQDVSMQEREISSFLNYKGITTYQVYQDEGYSGKNTLRPAFKTLLNDIKQGKVKELVVWRLDRLGRKLRDLVDLVELLKQYKVNMMSVKESIDLSTSTGYLMIQLLGVFSEFERNVNIERTLAGLKNARAKGSIIGRPSKLSDTIKERMRQLRLDGLSFSAISKVLNVNIGSVHHYLTTIKTIDAQNQANTHKLGTEHA